LSKTDLHAALRRLCATQPAAIHFSLPLYPPWHAVTPAEAALRPSNTQRSTLNFLIFRQLITAQASPELFIGKSFGYLHQRQERLEW
jgi:hypothetical protein